MDDGSTDGSEKLCDSLASKERVSVLHQENAGVSAARNVGMDFALKREIDCKYIAFLDADDIWNSNVITAELLAVLEQSCEVDMYAFGSVLADNSINCFSKPVTNKDILLNGSDSIWMLQNRHFGAILYSVSLLCKYMIRFPMGLKYNEDKIFFNAMFLYVPKGVFYRKYSSYISYESCICNVKSEYLFGN